MSAPQAFAPHVLYEDNHLLAVCKPPMMPVQADASGDLDLLGACKAYIKEAYQKPGAVFLGLVHRLDRPVGGVMVFARTSKAAARLQKQMQAGQWQKKYLAVVEGLPQDAATLEDHLHKDPQTHSSQVVAAHHPAGKPARLHYQCLGKQGGLALLSIDLYTGRHHQIRVQLSSRGLPIWGDARYNPHSRPGQPIALWAHSLTLLHPTKGETLSLCVPPPVQAPWDVFPPAANLEDQGLC